MASVIPFQDHALARLRERLGEAEGARDDLIAFARGHSGLVASIHQAVLAAIATGGVDELFDVVTGEWPRILDIDEIALALVIGDEGFQFGPQGAQPVEPQIIFHAMRQCAEVEMRAVGRGHPLFGLGAVPIRAEALIRIDCGPGLPTGLMLLGQHAQLALESGYGGQLLQFLGQSLAAMITRWLTTRND